MFEATVAMVVVLVVVSAGCVVTLVPDSFSVCSCGETRSSTLRPAQDTNTKLVIPFSIAFSRDRDSKARPDRRDRDIF